MNTTSPFISSYYTSPSVKRIILDFVHGRKCQLHYGVDKNNQKMASKFFMLHEKNYDNKIKKIHPKYKTTPVAIHCTPSRYIMYPLRAEGLFALDLVLDLDGNNYDENYNVYEKIKKYFFEHELVSLSAWRTRGKHDGIQIKVPFECFIDKTNITSNDIVEIKQFYLKLTWILNNIVTKNDIIELKAYDSTFRVPYTFNETTYKFCEMLYENKDVEYLSGEALMNRVECIWNFPFYHKLMKREIRFPYVSKKKLPDKIRVYDKNMNPKDFPPCFRTGMFTNVRKNKNREMIIFATWCFLKGMGWENKDIINYLLRWKRACKIDDEMDFDIKEKHKNRKLGGISCSYIKNQAKFCIENCVRTSPMEETKT